MQTKQQIQRLLASAGVSPNKRYGQNFLIDLNLMKYLVDSADIHQNDIVLEAGCGTGSLTEALAQRAGGVIAVEFDQTLSRIAGKQLEDYPNVEVIATDVLENKNTINRSVITALQQARQIHTGRLMLVANLPYSVASPVMMNLVTGPDIFADGMYVTVQKEVAERMTATTSDSHYGTLSILLGVAGDLKTLRTLKPTVFWPEPQVDSAMISFVRNKNKASQIKSITLLNSLVSLFMQHRRKMLQACTRFASGQLAQIRDWHQLFEQCAIDPHNRPEQITPEEFLSLANLCFEYLDSNSK
jgi:16S rRNA (adenine1518-N6/adenine1519-N6)-dimethyltransferase